MIFNVHHHFRDIENGIYNLDLEEKIPKSYFSAGLHPNRIDENWEYNLDNIKNLSLNKSCVAIGECGLDGLIKIDETLQEQVFERQILWANEIQKPVIVHCVRRFSQLFRFRKMAKIPLIIHGFSKKPEVAKELINKGFYLSLGANLLNNQQVQDVAKISPIENIFLETDTAEMDINEVYKKLSELKNIDLEKLKFIIFENTIKIFKIN